MVDNALGAFLRTCREATGPGVAGLPSGPRRRTPGLRREELAALADVSVEYLIRLERGRDRRPSGQVLGALADALRLGTQERVHLHRLAKAGEAGPCSQWTPPERALRPTVAALLARLEPAPALVLDPSCDVLASTAGFRRLAAPAGLLNAEWPNLARFVFTDPAARVTFPEWDPVADTYAATLRAAADLGDPWAGALADELAVVAGAPFAGRYATAARMPAGTGVQRWRHPVAGDLRLAYESLALAGAADHRVVVYLPADEATATALDGLEQDAVVS